MITAMASGFFRVAFDSEAGGSMRRNDSACSPRRPSITPNSTF